MKDGLALALESGLELVGKNSDGFATSTVVGSRVVVCKGEVENAE